MYAGGRVLAWRAHQLDDLRLRARARTRRAALLERDTPTPACRPCRRTFGLSDLAQPAPSPTWSPDTLADLASRVHGTVPRAEAEPIPEAPRWGVPELPFLRLDQGATQELWRSAVYVDDAELLVPLWRPNRDLSVLGSVAAAYAGFAMSLIGGLGGVSSVIAAIDHTQRAVGTSTTAAVLSFPIHPGALPVVLACGAIALLGTLLFLGGMLGTWRSTRRADLRITLHGIRYVGQKISFDEILGVRAENGGLVFQLLDGSELATPEGSLEPLVAESLGDELSARLPSPEERAAAFVAYERARQALRLG